MTDLKALEEMIDELRLSLHRITQVSEEIHAHEPISIGMRGVLEYLLRNSNATVPTIARSRHVSRQLIQTLVNALIELDLVVLIENPAHRRSPLASLTREGEQMIQRMRRNERKFFAALPDSVSGARMTAATRTLRALRAQLSEETRTPGESQ